ncbi:MAG: Bax inhibitor-1/YccA family protein [Epsilonproteobacteria bacterium]|nr:Bax inhibitor-1/YccA family protein [Campylobacterota bacterium]
MALYERDYVRSEAQTTTLSESRVSFLKQTYLLLALSMIAAALGAYLTMPFAATIMKYKWFIFGAELLVLFFGLSMSRGKPGLNLFMLFLFTFLTGVSLVPLLSFLIGAGKGYVIGNAFLATAVLFGALSLFAINSKTDFSSWGKPLFITLIIVVIASIINIFLGSGILGVIINAAILLLFGLFTIYDTQNIVNGAYDSPVDAAVSLYLDFLNMFTVILQFLGIMGDD